MEAVPQQTESVASRFLSVQEPEKILLLLGTLSEASPSANSVSQAIREGLM